jgi:hypothetical protein
MPRSGFVQSHIDSCSLHPALEAATRAETQAKPRKRNACHGENALHRASTKLIGTLIFAFMLSGDLACAQGTLAAQNACRPDVFRLCSSYIRDAISFRATRDSTRSPQARPASLRTTSHRKR